MAIKIDDLVTVGKATALLYLWDRGERDAVLDDLAGTAAAWNPVAALMLQSFAEAARWDDSVALRIGLHARRVDREKARESRRR